MLTAAGSIGVSELASSFVISYALDMAGADRLRLRLDSEPSRALEWVGVAALVGAFASCDLPPLAAPPDASSPPADASEPDVAAQSERDEPAVQADAPPDSDPCPGALVGSYDLSFVDVTGYDPIMASPLSQGLQARLDIVCGNDGPVAVLSTWDKWSTALSVERTSSAVLLQGEVRIPGQLFDDDSWTTFALALDADGGIAGAFHAEGESVWCYDYANCHHDPIAADGTVGPDVSSPRIVQESVRRAAGPADELLPWDDIVVRLSEPASSRELTSQLALATEDSPAQESAIDAWEFEPDTLWPEVPGWDGVMRIVTRFPAWTEEAHRGHQLVLRGPVFDRSGNLALIPSPVLRMRPLAGPSDIEEFSPAGAPTAWGAAVSHPLQPDPQSVCDAFDCIVIPAVEMQTGGDGYTCRDRAGVATLLVAQGAAAVRLRVRFLDAFNAPGYWSFGLRFYVDIVLPDGARSTFPLDPGYPIMHDLDPGAGDYLHASGWMYFVFPIGAAVDVVGVAVWTGTDGGGNCAPNQPLRAVAVDRISVE